MRYCRNILPYIPNLGAVKYISPVQTEHQHFQGSTLASLPMLGVNGVGINQ